MHFLASVLLYLHNFGGCSSSTSLYFFWERKHTEWDKGTCENNAVINEQQDSDELCVVYSQLLLPRPVFLELGGSVGCCRSVCDFPWSRRREGPVSLRPPAGLSASLAPAGREPTHT